MKRRIERAPLPDAAALSEMLSEAAGDIREGAVLIDGHAQGASGIDLLMVDQEGRPVFIDIVTERPDAIPARIFEHIAWMRENERLFQRAYRGDGVREEVAPEFVFISGGFPAGVVAALDMLSGTAVRLIRAEYLVIDGEGEVLLEQVAATEAALAIDQGRTGPLAMEHAPRETASAPVDAPAAPAYGVSREGVDGEAQEERAPEPPAETITEMEAPRTSVPGGTDGRVGDGVDEGLRPGLSERLERKIESSSVQSLLRLFRSGVDGLDARISEAECEGGVCYELEGRRLARLSASAGSFTVTLGDRSVNPIVVSDRVSLERALNAVVSLFVREEQASSPAAPEGPSLDDDERKELLSIWGGGVTGGDG